MYQPIDQWIPLDRDASPTTASTNLYNALVAAGAKPVNLGQGREIVELPLLQKLTIEAFEQAIKGGKLLNSKYGASMPPRRPRARARTRGAVGSMPHSSCWRAWQAPARTGASSCPTRPGRWSPTS